MNKIILSIVMSVLSHSVLSQDNTILGALDGRSLILSFSITATEDDVDDYSVWNLADDDLELTYRIVCKAPGKKTTVEEIATSELSMIKKGSTEVDNDIIIQYSQIEKCLSKGGFMEVDVDEGKGIAIKIPSVGLTYELVKELLSQGSSSKMVTGLVQDHNYIFYIDNDQFLADYHFRILEDY